MERAMDRKTALVVGAQGVIGRNLVEHLATLEDWQVIGLSRRGGETVGRIRHIAVDLLDPADARDKLGTLNEVTHIFYAAFQDRPNWAELVAPNLAMLVNAVEAAEAPGLRHVSLMQGYKVYGGHLGPFKTPAREDDPGPMPPEFMIDQLAWLQARAETRGWGWSAIRPAVVGGTALGNPMNLAVAIAVYASMAKELGLPFRFPGKPGAYGKLLQVTDSGLLARATVWAATDPVAAGQAFNIANGDLFRWTDLWPRLARFFDLETAPPLPMPLDTMMADKEPLWRSMIERHGLAPTPYRDVSSWRFADFIFGLDYDMFGDTAKSQRFGFHEVVDTEAMFLAIFRDLRQRRIIP